jgi:hypothetical protein
MKIRTLVIASAMMTAASSFAFAQGSPAPANQSGGGVTNTQAPTDQGIAGQGGNTKGTPTGGAMNRPAPATTGAAAGANAPTAGSNMRDGADKNASPASSSEGVKTEK